MFFNKEANLEYVISLLMVLALMAGHQVAHYLAYGQEWVDFKAETLGSVESQVGKTAVYVIRVFEVAVASVVAAWYPVGYLVSAMIFEAYSVWTIRKKIVARRKELAN